MNQSLAGLPGAAGLSEEMAAGATVSETARFIGEHLMPLLPAETHVGLHPLLGALVTFPTPAVTRRRLLGVILDVLEATHELPSKSAVHEEATRQGKQGYVSAVERRFGSYAHALDAGSRLFYRGTAAREPSRARADLARAGDVTPTVVLDGCEKVWRMIGHRPTYHEYMAVVHADKRLRAALGLPNTRLIHVKRIEKLFGTFTIALDAVESRARQRVEKTTEPVPAAGPRRGSPKGRSKPRRQRSKDIRTR